MKRANYAFIYVDENDISPSIDSIIHRLVIMYNNVIVVTNLPKDSQVFKAHSHTYVCHGCNFDNMFEDACKDVPVGSKIDCYATKDFIEKIKSFNFKSISIEYFELKHVA